ncbi:hypothetical protein HH303_13890 [Rhodospirillaceae bacterium KN72]|uniref:Uncharacterized protein n=1 Tax=Pacificispira spongiicola TaxID=2729598 RepID=A0A7Y0E1M3_9PROT|nr:hypothetical protein [Pacificispira spongiicola]NMM45582.1 hypothetical protein [Pacificispira spongiicola]
MLDRSITSCAVVFDRSDVDALRSLSEQSAGASFSVLPLTPTAALQARGDGYDILSATDYFGDAEQRLVVPKLVEIRQSTEEALQSLPQSEREIVRAQFDRMIFSQLRLHATLASFETCTVRHNGTWHTLPAAEAAALLERELIARRCPNWIGSIQSFSPPPFPGLFRMVQRALARVVRWRSPKGRVVLGAYKDVMGAVQAIESAGGRVVVVEGSHGSLGDYSDLFKQFLKVLRKQSPIVFRVFGRQTEEEMDMHKRVATATGYSEMQVAADGADAAFRKSLSGISGAKRQLDTLFGILDPTAFLSAEVSRGSDYLAAECIGRRGGQRVVLGRNAQGPTSDPMAVDFKRQYLLSRYPAGMTDVALFWDARGVEAGRQFLDDGVSIGRVATASSLPGDSKGKPVRADGKRAVLVADSFGSWWTRHWWALQTSDEYVDGLTELVNALKSVPNVHLTIRGKEKSELRVAELAELFADEPHVTVEGRERPFSETLLEADLLVSFFSTTIQEARQVGCPVLVYGGTQRHMYAEEAQRTLAESKDEAAIFGYDGSVNLSDLIESVLNAKKAAFDDITQPRIPQLSIAELGTRLARGVPVIDTIGT